MIVSKMQSLKTLIDSAEGIHLTAYLEKDNSIYELKRQIRETIEITNEHLHSVMKPEELEKFLDPLRSLMEDQKLLQNIKNNLGLFRTHNSFRVLSIPVEVEQTCIVATTFHVKPLLRWIQADPEFLFLGITDNSASLYHGNQNSLSLVENVSFPVGLCVPQEDKRYSSFRNRRHRNYKVGIAMQWLNSWLVNKVKTDKPQLFVAGASELTQRFLYESEYPSKYQFTIRPSFSHPQVPEICQEIRTVLKEEAKRTLEKALLEFYNAEDLNMANKNIFQIAKGAIQGKVRKLIIADGINIFGKFNRKTGVLKFHPTHLDHEDDDVLDDLAQEVLKQGGEVVVADRTQIPKGRPVLAIMDEPQSVSMEKNFLAQETNLVLKYRERSVV